MKITISQEAYDKHRKKKQAVVNKRLRAKDKDILDALLSVNMTSTPERQKTLEVISKLN